MAEIDRLRARLKNVQRNVTEYRMTVVEAKNLLEEIDELSKIKEKPPEVIVIEPAKSLIRLIDGGTF